MSVSTDPYRRELEDACDYDSMVRESEGGLPDLPADELLRGYREARSAARERRARFFRFVAHAAIVLLILAALVLLLTAGLDWALVGRAAGVV